MTERFAFGKNWRRFLRHLNEERILEAEKSLQKMLARESLDGLTFLDMGSGSGLFSLAARRLGAKVRSFDYDADSVACTAELKGRFHYDDESWEVSCGDALDEGFVDNLGAYDIVYSWGVLHHTGDMYKGLEHAGRCVKPGGQLFVAIYNDQGGASKRWRMVKQIYCSCLPGRWLVTVLGSAYFFLVCLKEDLIRFKNPFTRYIEYKRNRGMSMFTDWIDWFGGYPFEVAKPEELFDFYRERGFSLEKMITVRGTLACFEMVLRKSR